MISEKHIELIEEWKEHEYLGIAAFLSCMQDLDKPQRTRIFVFVFKRGTGHDLRRLKDPFEFFLATLEKCERDWDEDIEWVMDYFDRVFAEAAHLWHETEIKH